MARLILAVMQSNAAPQLRRLGAEPFGQRLARARRASGVELREAAEKISTLMFTSHTRLHQLEKLDTVPSTQQRRALAYLAMLVYGFDPAELGLSEEDLPKGLQAVDLTVLVPEPPDGGGDQAQQGSWCTPDGLRRLPPLPGIREVA